MRLVLLLLALTLAPLLTAARQVPGSSVSLEPPPGMEPSSRFAGFQSKTEDASVTVTEMAAPSVEAIAGFRDVKKLEAQRMTLEKGEKVKLASGEADLFVFKQRYAGINYRKLVLALGDEKRTVLVTASCDMDIAAKWEPVLRASLLTVTLGQQHGGPAGFRLEPKGILKQARAMTGSLAFTPNGEFPPKDPRAPVFLATRSVAAVPVASLAQFAETRAKAFPGVSELRVSESNPIKLDGLDGHELIGVANQSTPAASLLVYEIVLRETEGGYYLLVGLAAHESAADYLQLFREMSATFSRK